MERNILVGKLDKRCTIHTKCRNSLGIERAAKLAIGRFVAASLMAMNIK